MAGEGCARGLAHAGDYVQHPARQPGLHRELGHAEDRQAGVFRGFHDDRVAHGQGGADDPAHDLRRIVPGQDRSDDAERFAQGRCREARGRGQRVAADLVGRAAVELQVACQGRHVRPGLAQGLAGIASLEQRELLGVTQDQRAQLGEDPAAVGRHHVAPRALVESLARDRHGIVNVLGHPARDGREDASVGRADDVDRCAGAGLCELTADERKIALDLGGSACRRFHEAPFKSQLVADKCPGAPRRKG